MRLKFHGSSLLLLVLAPAVFAELGGTADSPIADSVRMNAKHSLTTGQSAAGQPFTVHTLANAGTTVKEYVSSKGTVFAVSWRGPYRPDLKQLMGTHYADLDSERSIVKKKSGRHPISVTHDDLIVRTGGHTHAFTGIAYLPQAMPQNVTPADLN